MTREGEIGKYAQVYRRDTYRMGQARLDAARRDLRGLTGSLLDIGCGRGEVMQLARELGLSPVHGTEVVSYLLGPDVTYAEAHALPFDDGSFDHVTCFDVLEHLVPEDTVPALREMARVARKTVTVTAADYSHVYGGVEMHVNRRPYEEWESVLREAFGRPVRALGNAGASRSWRIDLTGAAKPVALRKTERPVQGPRPLEDLRGKHAGETFVILGGGAHLAEEMRHAPPGIRISANEHGCRWGTCDYIVAMDDIADKVRSFGVPVIGQHPGTADYLMSPIPTVSWSGAHAVYAAWVMGASQVVLAGMGLYHDVPGARRPGTPPFAEHIRCWEVVRTSVPVGIRALGGPLVWMFGYYDPDKPAEPAEQVTRVSPPAKVDGIAVRVIANGSACGRRYVAGTHAIIRPDELRPALAAGLVERV